MNKKPVFYVPFIILSMCSALYATSMESDNQRILRSLLDSQDKRLSHPFKSSLYAQSYSIRTTEKAVKMQPEPTVYERRVEVQNTIQQLSDFSLKSSSDIRREIKKLQAQKGKRLNDADIKRALDMADKYERYALRLQQKEKVLKDDKQDIDRTLQTMTDMSQQLQLQLQDAMNKQQQAMQMMSNIMKSQHDTLKSMINNLK